MLQNTAVGWEYADMSSMTVVQNSFNSGELSPLMSARIDQARYASGCRTLRNMLLHPHGAVQRRAGYRFMGEAHTLSAVPNSMESSSVSGASDSSTLFTEQGESISSAPNPPQVQRTALVGVPSDSLTSQTLAEESDQTNTAGTAGTFATTLGVNASLTSDSITNSRKQVRLIPFIFNEEQAYVLEFGELYMRVWFDGGLVLAEDGTPLVVESPWTAEQIWTLRWCQSADMLYFVSHASAPRRLERRGHTDWMFTIVSFVPEMQAPSNVRSIEAPTGTKEWKYVVTSLHTETGEESLPSAVLTVSSAQSLSSSSTIKIAWDAVADATEYRVYRAGGGTSVYGLLGTAGTGEEYVDTGLSPDFDKGPPEARNPFDGQGNWPCCATFWQQRLCFAGSESHPQTIWASRSGAYGNFSISRPLRDDDAVTVTIAADTVSAVRWLMPAKRLLIGTGGGEWTLSGLGEQPFSPLSCKLERQSARGGSGVQPLPVGDGILALQRDGRVVREFTYRLETDGYSGNDLSILAEHLTHDDYIIDWAWQQVPHSTVWCVTEKGRVLAMTRIPEHDIIGWHQHSTEGKVGSLCCIPGKNGDELWLTVYRQIEGQTRCYIERLDPPFADDTANTAFFLDSGLSYHGEPVSQLSGLDHLEGCSVEVLADGATLPARTVVQGSIRLDYPASHVHVGLGYVSELESLAPEGLFNEKPSLGKVRRITRIRVRLRNSVGLWAGAGSGTVREIPFRRSSHTPNATLPLWSGDKELPLEAAIDSLSTVRLQQRAPLPLTILALSFDVDGGDI